MQQKQCVWFMCRGGLGLSPSMKRAFQKFLKERKLNNNFIVRSTSFDSTQDIKPGDVVFISEKFKWDVYSQLSSVLVRDKKIFFVPTFEDYPKLGPEFKKCYSNEVRDQWGKNLLLLISGERKGFARKLVRTKKLPDGWREINWHFSRFSPARYQSPSVFFGLAKSKRR